MDHPLAHGAERDLGLARARQRQRRQVSRPGAREQRGIRQLPGHAGVQVRVPARTQLRGRLCPGQLDDRLVPSTSIQAAAAVRRGRRLLHGKLSMNVTRIAALLTLAASVTLSACGGGGAPTTATGATAPTSQAASYNGPAPATADVQAFAVNFWANVRVQNRCGQCHNATSPAQMPNFARSDDVNLAYAQANTVVNLAQPSTSLIVTKVSGGHNCWLADPQACGQILTTWISNWAGATGAASATQVQLVAPPVQSVGQSLNFPASYNDYQNTVYNSITPLGGVDKYCVRCHSSTASAATMQSPYFADPTLAIAYPAAIPKIDFTGCSPFVAGNGAGACGTNSRLYQRLKTDNHNCWDNCAADAALMLAQIQAFAQMLTPANIDPSLVVSKALTLTQGTIASGANRYDADTIAKYEFQTGSGYTAYDTSGLDPAADLTISGNVP